ncbi:MAG: S8 family serine peptidase, partial [Gammaproteobacteria bacterium]|nr:S8 family serine peptidase [Gammaproteobacteria bacterium]
MVRNMRFEKGQTGIRSATPSAVNGFDLSVFEITDDELSIEQAISELQATGQVEYAEPDYPLSINTTPNDTSFSQLYGLHNTGQNGGTADADIDAPEAWGITTGSSSVIVAVIDTGVQYDHPDLISNMWVNPGEIAGNGTDDDNNGYIDDIYGIDTFNNDSDPMDDNSHGTHVAGTIGAIGNNGQGIAGVNWNVSIMALKYLSNTGNGLTSDAVELLTYINNMKVNHGIDIRISNNSWGGGSYSQALYDAIVLTESAGILFVAAAGNDGVDNETLPHYPSSYDLDSIIAVAATDRNDDAYTNTNYGLTSVDLAAPGVSIYSTVTGSSYGTKTGTSMATPHVAGAAALLWAKYPALSMQGVKQRLLNSAEPVASMDGITLTGGRLNAYNALSCETGSPKMYITSPNNNSVAVLGENTPFQLQLSDCGNVVTDAVVTVTPDNADPVFNLLDDGVAPDNAAGDGIYSGNWMPGIAGSVNLAILASNTGGAELNDQRTLTAIAVPTYTASNTYPYTWADASDGTDILSGGVDGGNLDDGDKEISIGFDFNFYGTVYNSVWVHTNGMLKFGATNPLSFFEFLNLPDTLPPNNYIASFWEDLNPVVSDGTLYSKLQGAAPNRRLIIQWHDLKHFDQVDSAGPKSSVTFQAILYESSNNIVVQYLDTTFGEVTYNQGARALTGVEFVDGSRGLEYANQAGGLNEQMAILYTPDSSSKKILTVDDDLIGGDVTDDQTASQINCPQNCFGQYDDSTTVILTATARAGYTFAGWSGASCSGTGNCTVTMDAHKNVSASFVVTPAIQVTPTSGLVTTEAGGSATFDMSLTTQPASDVTVALSSDNTGEGSVNPASVTFTSLDWDQAHTVTINGQNDEIDDGNITYHIVTSLASSGDQDYAGLNPADVSVSNTDNDTFGITITPLTGLTTTEAGGKDTFTVKLNTLPTHNVTLALSSSNTDEGTIDQSLLTFTPLNGQSEQTVTISGINDEVDDGDVGYSIVTAAA